MSAITIYNSKKSAIRAAKNDYANIFNCKPSSIRIEDYDGHYAPNNTRCVCGETACYELRPKNMSEKQKNIWKDYQEKNGMIRFFWYGVCSCCGEKF